MLRGEDPCLPALVETGGSHQNPSGRRICNVQAFFAEFLKIVPLVWVLQALITFSKIFSIRAFFETESSGGRLESRGGSHDQKK